MVTSFWHALGFLDPGTEHFLGRHEEDPVPGLSSIHHAQLVHQEAGAALHVLPPHLARQTGVREQGWVTGVREQGRAGETHPHG